MFFVNIPFQSNSDDGWTKNIQNSFQDGILDIFCKKNLNDSTEIQYLWKTSNNGRISENEVPKITNKNFSTENLKWAQHMVFT